MDDLFHLLAYQFFFCCCLFHNYFFTILTFLATVFTLLYLTWFLSCEICFSAMNLLFTFYFLIYLNHFYSSLYSHFSVYWVPHLRTHVVLSVNPKIQFLQNLNSNCFSSNFPVSSESWKSKFKFVWSEDENKSKVTDRPRRRRRRQNVLERKHISFFRFRVSLLREPDRCRLSGPRRVLGSRQGSAHYPGE